MSRKRQMCPLDPAGNVYHQTFRRAVGGRSNDGSDQRTRKECWGARSADGRWVFERIEIPGTPWDLLPADPDLRAKVRFVASYGSLAKAREAVARGSADRELAARLARVGA